MSEFREQTVLTRNGQVVICYDLKTLMRDFGAEIGYSPETI